MRLLPLATLVILLYAENLTCLDFMSQQIVSSAYSDGAMSDIVAKNMMDDAFDFWNAASKRNRIFPLLLIDVGL